MTTTRTFLTLAGFLAGTVMGWAESIVIEAEDFASVSAGSTFNMVDTPDGSGGKVITASDNNYVATATYTITVPTTGFYTLYLRAFSPSNADDSLYLPSQAQFEGALFPNVRVNNLSNGNVSSYRWVNTKAGTFVGEGGITENAPLNLEYNLTAGTHDFTIRAREDGLMIDALVFSTDDAIAEVGELDDLLASTVVLEITEFRWLDETTLQFAWGGGDGTNDIEASTDGEQWAPVLQDVASPQTVTVDPDTKPLQLFRIAEPALVE